MKDVDKVIEETKEFGSSINRSKAKPPNASGSEKQSTFLSKILNFNVSFNFKIIIERFC